MRSFDKVTIAFLVFLILGCSQKGEPPPAVVDEKSIIQLSELTGKTYQQILGQFGRPEGKTDYTIENAPTKGWNHEALFSHYPKNEENNDIHIMEVTWDLGDHLVFACFHIVEGENRCLIAKRIKKGVRF